MSLLDKVNTLKQVLEIVLKVTNIILTVVESVIEKVGDINANG